MDFAWLNTFLEVVRQKSFSRAGEKLHVTQPSISAQIGALETYLGHRLLERGGGKVTLTAAGRVFQPFAEHSLNQLKEVRLTLDDMERFLDDVGLENVKATVDISHFWLMRIPPAALTRLKGRIAQVHVSDCDGLNQGDLPPGRGNTPFGEYLSAIRDAGFAGAASVELEFPPDSNRMRDWVAEAYDSTLREMRAVGVR